MRLFLAIDLPDDVKGRLVHTQKQWEKDSDGHRPAWIKPANLHVTL
jgi:2'-5' RNA ligase